MPLPPALLKAAALILIGSSQAVAQHPAATQATLTTGATAVPSIVSSPGKAADTSNTAMWRVGAFVGVAHNSPAGNFLGITPGRDHLFVGLQALTTVLRLGPVRASYAVQFLPLVLIRGRTAPLYYDGNYTPNGEIPEPNIAYAYGVSPFGFELALPLGHVISAYGAAAAGGLVFSRPFPVPEGTRINFTLEYGGGFLVHAGHSHWVQLGYKYHHLSNAYTGVENPGLDANVFYVGYQWAVRLPR